MRSILRSPIYAGNLVGYKRIAANMKSKKRSSKPVSYTHLDVYKRQREDRKWRIWKEAEEKLLRECGVDEATIEQIRMARCV